MTAHDTTPDLLALAQQLVYRELRALDDQDWPTWLSYYHPDAEYWVPAWDKGLRPTTDPQRELSLIYCASRRGLEERVSRLVSGRSPASTPLRRTAHAVTNLLVERTADQLQVHAVFHTMTYDWVARRDQTFFGTSTYRFHATDAGWLIRHKRQVLMNDALPGMVDFYWL